MRYLYVGLVIASLGLTGCSSLSSALSATKESSVNQLTTPQVQVPPVFMPSQTSIEPVAVALAQSAIEIQNAVTEMKAVVVASKLPDITPNKKAQLDASELMVPPGLGNRITVSHDGVYTTLVEALATSVGWSYMSEGNRPPVIQVVHKDYQQVRVVDALRDLGYTIQGAKIVVDSINRRIIVRFQ